MARHRGESIIDSHLDEIRELENKLINLKRQFLDKSSVFLESLVDENGAIPFLIAFGLGHHFAIPVSAVEEVIEMVAVTPVVEKRQGLMGIFNYHGKLTALFDLASVANVGTTPLSPDNVIAVCSIGERVVGLMVSEATDVYMVQEKDLCVSEEVLPGSIRAIGIVKLKDTITASIIDIWSTMMGVNPEELHSEAPPDNDA